MIHPRSRWNGQALIAAGAALAIGMLIHPPAMPPDALTSPQWLIAHAVIVGSVILSLFGLSALHAAQAERSGWLGAAGFALSFVGSALVVVAIVFDAFVVPALSADPAGRALAAESGPLLGGPLGITLLLAGVSYALGTLMLGAATVRAGVLPRVAGSLLALGGPLMGLTPPLPELAFLVGALLVSASYIWLGLALRGARQRVVEPGIAGA